MLEKVITAIFGFLFYGSIIVVATSPLIAILAEIFFS